MKLFYTGKLVTRSREYRIGGSSPKSIKSQRQKQPNYNPEFVDKAVDLVLSLILPDKQLAKIPGVNASTLASWKSKRLHSATAQPQSSLILEVGEDNGKAIQASRQEHI